MQIESIPQNAHQPLTQKQVGERLGISQERVRQIEHNALKKLRRSLERRLGPDWFDSRVTDSRAGEAA